MKSRFATETEIFSQEFKEINSKLLKINVDNNLIDHDAINAERFSDWFQKLNCTHSFYGSRFWEYPFAILNADLKAGMKCADIGCGSTPFTPLLCDLVGKDSVTGFDPDFVVDNDEDRHLSFGTRKSHIDKFGFHFKPDNFTKLSSPDNYFDRVFCISVLEHIEDNKVKENGLREMARVLKPGGRLIITFDTGLDMILNPIFKIIELTGLSPCGEFDARWPIKRFVDYGDSCIDVFGLVLEKQSGEIFADYHQQKSIPAFKANDKYLRTASWFNIPYNAVLKIQDLSKIGGPFRVWLKSLLKRY